MEQKKNMYYRRKLLLALLEIYDGNLGSTDCEKLLFEFCQITGKNHYDFFPYLYGPFSFISYYDKRRLTEMGLLQPVDGFRLSVTSYSYFNSLKQSDKKALLELNSMGLHGQSLVKKVYREYPQYASRSKIVADMFGEDEFKLIRSSWNSDNSPAVFTLGYEGLTIDAFLNKLIAHNIMAIVDIRNNPQSMKYGFSKKSFSEYIEKAGIKYLHIPELGIPSTLRKGLGSSILHENLFRKYETELLPKQSNAKNQLQTLISRIPRVALVCFEADYRFCHRDTLVKNMRLENRIIKPILHI